MANKTKKARKGTVLDTGRLDPRMRRCADGQVLQRAWTAKNKRAEASRKGCRKGNY